MSWRKQRDRDEFFSRKSQRYSRIGDKFEHEVADLLARMKEDGRISHFIHHEKHSKADQDGMDFTVWVGDTEKSFGVTISMHSWNKAKQKHPYTPQFCFPIGANKSTIIDRILSLFETVEG
jgi:hypothetical protein